MQAHNLFTVDNLFSTRTTNGSVGPRTYRKTGKHHPKKLGYFLASDRWKSCVTTSLSVGMGAVFGKAFDI